MLGIYLNGRKEEEGNRNKRKKPLQIEENSLPFVCLFIYSPSRLSVWRSGGEIAYISSCPALYRKTLYATSPPSAQNAAARLSSADKLPPPASFFTISSSNTLTRSPCALLNDNKNNRWAPGDGMRERTNRLAGGCAADREGQQKKKCFILLKKKMNWSKKKKLHLAFGFRSLKYAVFYLISHHQHLQ